MSEINEKEYFNSLEENSVSNEGSSVYAKQRYAANEIGWRFAGMGIVVIGLQYAMAFLLEKFAPDFYANNLSFVSLMFTLITFDIVGTLVIYAITKGMNKVKIEKKKMSFGHFVVAVLISAFFCCVGSVIGTIVHTALTLPFGQESTSELALIMLDSSMWLRVLVVGICAPVFEEFIFRKLLIDRTVQYGEFFAIFLSGIFFGLFHGNFAQFFFATALGFFFAFIYVKTGNVWYTVALHMVINMTSSVITSVLGGKCLEAIGDRSVEVITEAMLTNPLPIVIYYLWLGFLGLLGLIGFILFVIAAAKKKFKLTQMPVEIKKGKTIVSTVFTLGFILFFAVTAFLFANAYVLPAIMSFVNAK